jgi:hypothetical protein
MRAYSFALLSVPIAITTIACGFPTVDIAPAEGTTSSTSGAGSGGNGGASASVTSVTSVTTTSTTNGTGGSISTSNTTVASSVTTAAQSTSASGSGGAVNCDVDGDTYKGKQCGGDDCDDGDADAHPNQTNWFSAGPSKGNKTWDYDCDGTVEQEFTMADICNAGGECPKSNLYVGIATPPACGLPGAWGSCVSNVLSCKVGSPISTQTQACH